MEKKFKKYISLLVSLTLILVLISVFTLRYMPGKVYADSEIETTSVFNNISPLSKFTCNKDCVSKNFMGLIPLKSVEVQNIKDLKLYPGGTSVGVRLSSNGVLIIGFSDLIVNDSKIESPAKTSGIELGDIIIKINGKNVYTTKEILNIVKNTKDDTINLTIEREGKNIEKTIKMKKENGVNKLGLWIRDSTAGVGTLTFYDSVSGKFGVKI